MILEKLLVPQDITFLFVHGFGVFMIAENMNTPQVIAGALTLLSTMITVGFNIYKLYRDNKNSDKPRKFRLRGRRGKKHETK
jgi:hypothetical protein